MAQKLGYHPDAFARSLRRRRSQTIGVLAYDLSDPFCIPIVRGIQAGLHPANYLPLLMDAQTQRRLFDSYLQMILERRAEGVIVIASWIFEETNLLADIEKNNVPIVIVGRDLTERKSVRCWSTTKPVEHLPCTIWRSWASANCCDSRARGAV